MPRRAALIVAVVFLATALAPAALADHVYSHQYRVFGRVLDSEGNPLNGALVFIEVQKTQNPDRISFRTSCSGDYGYGPTQHFHMHGISTIAELAVTVYDPTDPEPLAEVVVEADRNLRKTHLDFTLEETGTLESCPGAKERIQRQVFVFGRLWNATKEQTLESIRVWGEVPEGCVRASEDTQDTYGRVCQHVDVEVTTDDGRRQNMTTRTTGYGDYFALFEFEAPVQGATAKASWLDREVEGRMDPVFNTLELDFIQGTPRDRPAPAGALVGSVVALAAAALLLASRRGW